MTAHTATPAELDAVVAAEVERLREDRSMTATKPNHRYKVWVVIERQTPDDGEDIYTDICAPVDVGPPFGYDTLTAVAEVFQDLTGEEPEYNTDTP
jgi:hypothetical protein